MDEPIPDNPISRRGMQIVYVPDHAQGDLNHPSCEEGFTWAFGIPGKISCYFFRHGSDELKPRDSDYDWTPKANLVLKEHRDQSIIDKWIKKLETETPQFLYGNS